jgi:hypothetical protein
MNEPIGKGAATDEDEIKRLTEIDTQFVSLVRAGANRQTKFLIVKAVVCPSCGAKIEIETEGGDCPICGKPLAAQPDGAEPPPPVVPPSEDVEDAKKEQPASAPEPGATSGDRLDWLDQASAELSATLCDALLAKVTLPDPNAGAEPAPAAPLATAPAPAPAPSPDTAALAKAQDEIAQLRTQLAKAERETATASARAEALKSACGTSAVLPAGYVTDKGSAASGGAKPATLWNGDLARKAADSPR